MQIMENSLMGEYIRKSRQYKLWQRIVALMVCIVVFGTTYALMLPAVTRERETFCGLDEHTHDKTCYIQQTETTEMTCEFRIPEGTTVLHSHNSWCYDRQHVLICQLDELAEHVHNESCYAEGTVHFHEESCYQLQRGELICSEEPCEGHIHGDACYEPGEKIVCATVETAGHRHDDSCYTRTEAILCGKQETSGHIHGNSCYTDTNRYVCGKTETQGHIHTDSCYRIEERQVCQKQETPGHSHSDACYSSVTQNLCGMEESDTHSHTEGCFAAAQTLTCGMTVVEGHTHDDACIVRETVCICNLTEVPAHRHEEACMVTDRKLTCTLEEAEAHRHTADCSGWKKTLSCTRKEVLPHSHDDGCLEKVLICKQAVSQGHRHEDACYEQIRQLQCGWKEGQEIPGELICMETECKPHIHGTDCADASLCREQQVLVHDHTEACITVTGPEADPETLTCVQKESDAHRHSEQCYGTWVTVCGKEEHTHERICYSDPDADVETAADWEAGFAHIVLTGNYREDVLAIAKTQLGYTESTKNYIIGDDDTIKGYTRYGAWYGNPYGDWCATFVSFCLHYANVKEAGTNWGVRPWIEGLQERGMYAPAEAYRPVPGDIVFFDWNGDDLSDHVGLVAEVLEDGTVKTIEGNSGNQVRYMTYGPESMDLFGYGILPDNPALREEEPSGYKCGMEEHTHEDACRDEDGEITCRIPEHTHTEDCRVSDAPTEETTEYAVIYTDDTFETVSDDPTRISITGILPVDAEIRAYPVAVDTRMQVLCAYEIEIRYPDGTVFEPAEGESLNVEFQSAVLEEQQDMQVFYIPEEGQPCEVTSVITEEGIQFEAPHFSVYAVTRAVADSVLPGAKYDGNGNLLWSYSQNSLRDAMVYDGAYSNYYNANSPIGTAGSFHIVAFGTATLSTHTNGNVLANTLIAHSNFGTNGLVDELSYVQNYAQVHTTSASGGNHVLVVGSSNTIGYANGESSLSVNSQTMASPKYIVQDLDTENAPFIDLGRVEAEIRLIAANMHVSEKNITKMPDDQGQYYSLTLTQSSGVGVANFTAAELANLCNTYQNNFRIEGFRKGNSGSVVINVDCRGASRVSMPNAIVYVDGVAQSTNEVTEFSNGKVIWNFLNAEGVTIEAQRMTGMVIAPGATVNINQNLNGTVVAYNVNVLAESHRTDFTGRIDSSDEDHFDGAHIHVYKVDKDNYGSYLPGAKFTLYEWNGSAWKVAQQNSRDQIQITDGEGKTIFQNLTYNVAYRLEETQAPPGYKVSTEYQYYYFPHSDTGRYPVRKPGDFPATDSDDCIIHYYPNEASDVEVTSLYLQKQWQDEQGNALENVPWDSVQVEINRNTFKAILDASGNLTYDADNNVIYSQEPEVSLLETVTIHASDDWSMTANNLPLTSDDRTEKYTYSARETGTEKILEPDENGVVTIVNKAAVTYVPLAVEKHWEEDVPAEIREITFRLYRMSRTEKDGSWEKPEVISDAIVLRAGNGWRWQAEENALVSQMSYGGETVYFAYYLEEVSGAEGYYPDYHGVTEEKPRAADAQEALLEVTNRKITYTSLEITKSWQDLNGEPMTDVPEEAVTVQIEQSDDGGETWKPYLEEFEIRKEDNWQYVAQALPLQDPSGKNLSYRVVESAVAGYLSSGGEVLENGEVHLLNRRIETTSVSVEKIWKNVNGSLMTSPPVDFVQVQLLRSVNGGEWTPYGEPFAVKAEDNWMVTVTDLPARDMVLEETYTYSIRELTVSDLYETGISGDSDGNITITNTRVVEATDIEVEKRWFNRSGSEFYANSGSVEVQLFQILQSSGGNGGSSGSMVNVTVNVGRWWSDGSFWNRTYTVPSGTKFTISYCVAGSEYKLALNDLNNTSARLTPVSVVPKGAESVITFEYVATQNCSLVGLLGYYQGGSMDVSYSTGIPVGTVQLSIANDWRYLFSDLPRYAYDEAGNITGSYHYFVEETGGAMCSATYSDANGNRVSADHPVAEGTVTVRNTLPENSYALPETGGSGSMMYTGPGLLMMAISSLLLLHTTKRRREDALHQQM